MITNAICLAIITFTGVVLIYVRLPRWLQGLIYKFNIIADISAFILAYIVLGGTATALIAAGLLGVAISSSFYCMKEYGTPPTIRRMKKAA